MKNRIKPFGLIVLVAVILATVGSCALPGVVTVKNNTGKVIWYVYIRPEGASDWGNNLLGPLQTIPNGLSKNFTLSGPGYYNFRVEDFLTTSHYTKTEYVGSGTLVTFTSADYQYSFQP
jgi:hypothetical protein